MKPKDLIGLFFLVGVPAILYLLAGGGAEAFYRGP